MAVLKLSCKPSSDQTRCFPNEKLCVAFKVNVSLVLSKGLLELNRDLVEAQKQERHDQHKQRCIVASDRDEIKRRRKNV
jgi:hypothetical protein